MKAKTDKSVARPLSIAREVVSVFALALSVFLLLCFISHSPQDPSFTVAAPGAPIENLGGRVGAILADLFFTAFGISAYLIPVSSFALSVAGLRLFPFRASWREALGLCSLVFSVPVLGTVLIGEAGSSFIGGLVGQGLSLILIQSLGRWGSVLLLLSIFLMGLILATDLALGRVLVAFAFKKGPAALAKIARLIASQWLLLWGRLEKIYRARKLREKIVKPLSPVLPTPVPPSVSPKTPVAQSLPFLETPPASPPPPLSLPLPTPPLNGSSSEPKILKKKEDDKKSRKGADSDQLSFLPPHEGEFALPSLSLLDSPQEARIEINEESLRGNAKLLENKLHDFAVEGVVSEIHPGPIVTMYEFVPAPGVKINKIVNLTDDLSLAMEGRQVRIVAPLPDKAAVGIEIPNHARETVWLKEILAHSKFKREQSKLLLALGKDISGECFVADLTKMPHLLVAGATGAGKSVSINTMILSLLYQAKPEQVRLIMVDPKMLELSVYQGIPHLLLPVVTDPKKAAQALRWAVKEMTRRYRLMADLNARNIINYNKKIEKGEHATHKSLIVDGEEIVHDKPFPYIVIIIDELADLMMVAGKEVEECITRLAQMARAAGIHLILATQRPSVDVLTGVIKANFPSRISFKVASKYDSRTILDRIGSEQLLGNGDMLFLPPGVSQIMRLHGAFVSETEIARIVEFLKQQGEPEYRESEILKPDADLSGEADPIDDELYDAAVAIVAETKQASISMVQRRLRIGYNRAARLIEEMQAQGVVSAPNGAKGREVLIAEV